ncbi:O-antigen ligase family protein [uncultured Helicobacter sp.]|uniref:O-antigen ligase family protein n=1 Tax=uncultured Helicobacter sp. TaxID=175537 RepID=UPI00374FB915
MWNRVRTLNQEIVLVIFCVGIFLYGIGLGNIKPEGFKGFYVQTLFHIGGALFVFLNYKTLHFRELKALVLPLGCFVVVIVLGILTMFDTILPQTPSKILKEINTHLLSYMILFLLVCLYAMSAPRRNVIVLCCVFVVMCAAVALASLYISGVSLLESGRLRVFVVPFFFFHVVADSIWLFGLSAVGIAGVFVCQRLFARLVFALIAILGLLAILVNGERAILLAFVAMVFGAMCIWHYRYKLAILCGIALLCIPLGFGVYHYTKTLPERHNFAHMLDNFWAVWQTPPIQMGKYDKLCFNGRFECAEQSTQNGKAEFSWEHSSLARLALYKSALHLIAKEPFTPHLPTMNRNGMYLSAYYGKDDPYRFYVTQKIGTEFLSEQYHFYGYYHIHSVVLSLLLSFGVIGFVAVCAFQAFLFYQGFRSLSVLQTQAHTPSNTWVRILIFAFMLVFVGIGVHLCFDVAHPIILQPLFILYGLFVGLCLNVSKEVR